jgi:AcrR family transcriptional regulator
MQIKKEEIRDEILIVAEKEFLKRGYKNASMRTIASKSHTTLGNLYNYFENKEAILDVIIGDTPERVLQIIMNHESKFFPTIDSKDYMEEHFDDLVAIYMPTLFPIELLLSNSLLILMEGCEGTKYESYCEIFLDLFQKHLAIHLNVNPDSFLARSFAHGFFSSLLYISKNKKNVEEGKNNLLDYIKTMTIGMPMPKNKS